MRSSSCQRITLNWSSIYISSIPLASEEKVKHKHVMGKHISRMYIHTHPYIHIRIRVGVRVCVGVRMKFSSKPSPGHD